MHRARTLDGLAERTQRFLDRRHVSRAKDPNCGRRDSSLLSCETNAQRNTSLKRSASSLRLCKRHSNARECSASGVGDSGADCRHDAPCEPARGNRHAACNLQRCPDNGHQRKQCVTKFERRCRQCISKRACVARLSGKKRAPLFLEWRRPNNQRSLRVCLSCSSCRRRRQRSICDLVDLSYGEDVAQERHSK
eukprot:Amastigsp_a351515_16.p2 type:complete len:193 gc:universal Amastigsp_a351515_16:609-31(-)